MLKNKNILITLLILAVSLGENVAAGELNHLDNVKIDIGRIGQIELDELVKIKEKEYLIFCEDAKQRYLMKGGPDPEGYLPRCMKSFSRWPGFLKSLKELNGDLLEYLHRHVDSDDYWGDTFPYVDFVLPYVVHEMLNIPPLERYDPKTCREKWRCPIVYFRFYDPMANHVYVRDGKVVLYYENSGKNFNDVLTGLRSNFGQPKKIKEIKYYKPTSSHSRSFRVQAAHFDNHPGLHVFVTGRKITSDNWSTQTVYLLKKEADDYSKAVNELQQKLQK